jgi:putative Holliday junction resolvase
VSPSGTLLGVDPGRVRVGLAISDPDRKFAFPLETYERRDTDRDASYFLALCAEHGVGGIVVGLPVHLDGREGPEAEEAREYAAWLGQVTNRPVTLWDERFTTVQAESVLWQAGLTHKQRKARRDRVAAQILLESYLESFRRDEG